MRKIPIKVLDTLKRFRFRWQIETTWYNTGKYHTIVYRDDNKSYAKKGYKYCYYRLGENGVEYRIFGKQRVNQTIFDCIDPETKNKYIMIGRKNSLVYRRGENESMVAMLLTLVDELNLTGYREMQREHKLSDHEMKKINPYQLVHIKPHRYYVNNLWENQKEEVKTFKYFSKKRRDTYKKRVPRGRKF